MEAALTRDTDSLWAPRRQMTLAQARRRSERVRHMRHGFIACAAISIGLFLGYILRSAIASDNRAVAIEGAEAVTMVNPRFTGRNSDGQIFTITAAAAQRRRTGNESVDLISPVMTDAMGAEVQAPSGFYDPVAGVLELYEDVQISDKAGYKFVSKGARIILGEDRVVGLSPLSGSGPLGDIRSDSYEILDGGNRIVFTGNVRTVIYPAPAPEAAPTEGE